MSRGINKVTLIGNLGQDPEIRYTQNSTPIANFSIATSEQWKDKNSGEPMEKTEWHKCVAYRKLAEIIGEYVKKGSKIYVEGKLQTNKWQTQDGQDRYTTEIVISEMQMLDSKQQGQQQYQGGNQNQANQNYSKGTNAQQQNPQSHQNNTGDAPQDFDDDIPF